MIPTLNNPYIYKFAASRRDGPLIVLSYANGFLPQTYAAALSGLYADYRVVAAHIRPMWHDSLNPADLQSWRVFGEDLLATINAITDAPVVGIGHSVGAIATAYAAMAKPTDFSHLILIDPTMLPRPALWGIAAMRLIGREARLPLVQQALRRGRHWDSPEAAYDYFRGKKLFTRASDSMVHAYTDSITARDRTTGGVELIYPPEWEAQIYRTIPTDVWEVPRALHRAQVPTLVIRAELSDVFRASGARRFARLCPGAQIVTVPGAGHLIPQEQPEAVGTIIRDFLKKTTVPRNP